MKARDIADIVKPRECVVADPDADVERLLTDSRRLASPAGTVFFAITTSRNSGTRYIDELYRSGVRQFVVPADCIVHYNDANIWRVNDVVAAMQRLAACKRSMFNIPVVGITGSNGKTIVKDWLVQLLSPDMRLVASPKSYNSQIGVPLSVWQMDASHQMGIFEAGISEAGEMTALQHVIEPTIGIFTNIGQAHDENFLTRGQKIAEKLQLFTHCKSLIYCADHKDIHLAVSTIESFRHVELYTWGTTEDCDLRLLWVDIDGETSRLRLAAGTNGETHFEVTIPFVDRASQENAMHCIALLLLLGMEPGVIAKRCALLTPVEMRMEMDEGTGNCLLINDSYSLDLNSLTIALDYLAHQKHHFLRTLIMSDILQAGMNDDELYAQVADQLRQRGINTFIGIGPMVSRCRKAFDGIDSQFYISTDDFLKQCDISKFRNETILLKGARVFSFERIAKTLQRKSHETVMEVNLDALSHNLNFFRSRLDAGTKLMAMVKASSYGAGTVEIANALQFQRVDYLTVAYADEGVELRRNGITLPIMVMNPEPAAFGDIVRYKLEPDIYNFRILDLFVDFLHLHEVDAFPIHVEFDTGMHRLGFGGSDTEKLRDRLHEIGTTVSVQSVFSHLACSEDGAEDGFTRMQIARLSQWSEGLPGIRHILNSSGIVRFPDAQMDMVRLGIGLYGVAPEPEVQCQLRQVSRLVTCISQIKEIPAGDSVGYNRRWVAQRPSRIAVLTIGYADGLHRGLGNGKGRVSVNHHEAPIVGSICMDMCFVDVTDIPCMEGDRAVIFGEGDLLQRNAAAAGTIPYELLTAVAPRVKRVYYHEE
ncbi:MAG: bifunctional UDP-N-acetylmuramoyl-tripeptide:D-alanyl-D-alanine ligase/alanine racemase [Bacteroidales bacterium]|nr:bifunctional UDP-N-acetylmuramoyl-tripeptide:D-alanyl-D-alanine ligase/alanine racemase [Bacteroidales bacterium]